MKPRLQYDHMIRQPVADSALVAFPLGGIGAGMLCLEGRGGLSHVSLRNHPDLLNSPFLFSAITLLGDGEHRTILLEGPVPQQKIAAYAAGAPVGATYGLPRLSGSTFRHAFPVAWIDFQEEALPLGISLTAWSPFAPLAADESSLPVAALEYHFENRGTAAIDFVYSFNARNFMGVGGNPEAEGASVRRMQGGFVLAQEPLPGESGQEGSFAAGALAAFVDEEGVRVNPAWYRGGHRFNSLAMLWNDFSRGDFHDQVELRDAYGPSVGGSLFLPITLAPGASKTVRLLLAWYVPGSDIHEGPDLDEAQEGCACACQAGDPSCTYTPWYAGRFASLQEVVAYWRDACPQLRAATFQFSRCFHDSTLPSEAVEAASANLSILNSTTVLRQTDGRLWCWEGSSNRRGCCYGSCTHVWNYAQAICHLFPDLERSLRDTEFHESQDERGHQEYRSGLPIRTIAHTRLAPADGQLGGIMKVFRDWRIAGDTAWLRALWPQVQQSLDYCIETWDPEHAGVVVEPHHNTYDIEFWGPDGMCSSFYLGALKAAAVMGHALGQGAALGQDVALYQELYEKGRTFLESELFNGEYFIQQVRWRGLRSPPPDQAETIGKPAYVTPEAQQLLAKEGPAYQYGSGCLSDGVLGAWLAEMCGLGEILDPEKVRSHLLAVYRYNFRRDLSQHANLQRPMFAVGSEGGLLLCTWPRGGKPSLPFIYSDEVWTGIEYQVASHLALFGELDKALDIVRTCRSRYNGTVRNPFDEIECGHWYARALASYGLLQGLTGIRYDAIDQTLIVEPHIAGDFRSFLCTQTGYGTAGIRDGEPFLEVVSGAIDVDRIVYRPYPTAAPPA